MSIEDLYKLYTKSNGVVTDSRKTSNNCIFFSLKGVNFNGNEFAKSAIENGALCAIVDEKNIFKITKTTSMLKTVWILYKNLQIFIERK